MKVPSALALLSLSLVLSGCAFDTKLVKDRSKTTGIPIHKQRVLTRLMNSGDKAEGLTQSEWGELEVFAKDPDAKVRLEAVMVIGGISSRKTTQKDKVLSYLLSLKNDPDQDVQKRVSFFLPYYTATPEKP